MKIITHSRKNLNQNKQTVNPYSEHESEVTNLAVIFEDTDEVKAQPVSVPAEKPAEEKTWNKKHKRWNTPAVQEEFAPRCTVVGVNDSGQLIDISSVAKLDVEPADSSVFNSEWTGMTFTVHGNPTIPNSLDAETVVLLTVRWTDPELSNRAVLGPFTKVSMPVKLTVVAKDTSSYLTFGSPRDAT